MNIVNHAYGDHRECGEWCRYQANPSKYKHEGLPGGKDLSDPLLKAALIPILSKYANKANRIAPCGSTQANENLNQMVSSKIFIIHLTFERYWHRHTVRIITFKFLL